MKKRSIILLIILLLIAPFLITKYFHKPIDEKGYTLQKAFSLIRDRLNDNAISYTPTQRIVNIKYYDPHAESIADRTVNKSLADMKLGSLKFIIEWAENKSANIDESLEFGAIEILLENNDVWWLSKDVTCVIIGSVEYHGKCSFNKLYNAIYSCVKTSVLQTE
jgi:hypothetical protein